MPTSYVGVIGTLQTTWPFESEKSDYI